jgi:hypothetical protein
MPVGDRSLLSHDKTIYNIKFFRSITGKYYEVELNESTTSTLNNVQMNNPFQQYQLTEGSYFIYYILSFFFGFYIGINCILFLNKKRRFSNSNNEIEFTNRTVLNNRE